MIANRNIADKGMNIRTSEDKCTTIIAMDRRSFSLGAAFIGIAALTGCEPDQKPSATASFTNNDKITSAMSTIDSITGDLETDSDNFGGENWRDVVPEVQEHIAQLRGAIDDLRAALEYPR